jgi:class 3 adenylate cyclase/tetratricopeptide (TPR) repeat protein
VCGACGAAQPAAGRFCDACGQPLDAAGGPPRATPEGERKQVTVLFADVVGSMGLAERTDPEAWRAIMDRLFALLCAGVERFGGTVDKFTGDGIMALFGAPVAHEDHARRACHAALELAAGLARHAEDVCRDHGLVLALRMGLNSGEVVAGAVGEGGATAYTAVGHTVGLAQRMEQLAEPGTAYLTEHTAALAEGYLELAELGPVAVKGASRPLRVFRLTGVGPARGRLDVAGRGALSPFVGRERELAALEEALEEAAAGHGLVVGIVGEAGVGKSRLCHELTAAVRRRDLGVLHVAGQAHTAAVPLLPVLELLRAAFAIADRDPDEVARGRVVTRLGELGLDGAEDRALLLDFLGIPDPEGPAPRIDPAARQRRLLALVKRLVRARSAREPGLILVEDLHWLDPASDLFLAHLVDGVQGTRSLLVANFRPEYRADWMSRSHYRQVSLRPLGDEAADRLVGDLLGPDPSVSALGARVAERARGNPFFAEELVRGLAGEGHLRGGRGAYELAGPVDEAAIPATVQAALAARIDRLAARDKDVLQAAAVIGREFSEPVLARVAGRPAEELAEALRRLVAAELVLERELDPEVLYAFTHPLTRDVAYRTQLAGRRSALHAAAARAITEAEAEAERLDERAALVAHHWASAGEELEAARWHARAAAWAGTAHPAQALDHWERVRELADGLPESPETTSLGLTARLMKLTFGWRLGMPADEAESTFREAEALAARAGDVRLRAILLNGYGAVKGVGEGDVATMLRLQRQSMALVEEAGDRSLTVALAPGAWAAYCAGELQEAQAMVDRAIEVADGDATLGAGLNYACPYSWCHGFSGVLHALRGEFDESRRLILRAREIAREHGDDELIGFSHLFDGYRAYLTGDAELMLAAGEGGLRYAEPIGNPFGRAYGQWALGMARVMREEWEEARRAFERARELAVEGRFVFDDVVLPLLAGCELALGADPVRVVGRAMTGVRIARACGNRVSEVLAAVPTAQALRAVDGRAEEAEALLTRALAISRDTGARAFEPLLRAELADSVRRPG